jgi:hypothetical protein
LSEQLLRREREITTSTHFDYASSFGLREDRIHSKSRHDDERLVPGIEIGGAEQVNRFVDTVREQDLRRIESKKTRYFFFRGLALGIARQEFRIERTQPGQHARRAPDRTFVEIET